MTLQELKKQAKPGTLISNKSRCYIIKKLHRDYAVCDVKGPGLLFDMNIELSALLTLLNEAGYILSSNKSRQTSEQTVR